MYFIFDRKNVIELSEWLHKSYFKNNKYIHKLTIHNKQLLEKLQDTCFPSYVSDCQMVYCLEDSHDMRDHESDGKLQVLNVSKYNIEERQSLFVVEEELEFPLENCYTLFEEVHDSTTLEPTYEESFTLLREVHNPTPMEPSHD